MLLNINSTSTFEGSNTEVRNFDGSFNGLPLYKSFDCKMSTPKTISMTFIITINQMKFRPLNFSCRNVCFGNSMIDTIILFGHLSNLLSICKR